MSSLTFYPILSVVYWSFMIMKKGNLLYRPVVVVVDGSRCLHNSAHNVVYRLRDVAGIHGVHCDRYH